MDDPIRFVADEHIPRVVIGALRQRNVDVVSFHDAGRRTLADAEQVLWARDERRTIVTYDKDFLVLARSTPSHAGIAYCHAQKYDVGGLIRALLALWESTTADQMADSIRFL